VGFKPSRCRTPLASGGRRVRFISIFIKGPFGREDDETEAVYRTPLRVATALGDVWIRAPNLGDTSDDLTYTPVTPCRILKTRGHVCRGMACTSSGYGFRSARRQPPSRTSMVAQRLPDECPGASAQRPYSFVISNTKFSGAGPKDAHGTTPAWLTPGLDQSHTPLGKIRVRRATSSGVSATA
jgi:hypothetical protein